MRSVTTTTIIIIISRSRSSSTHGGDNEGDSREGIHRSSTFGKIVPTQPCSTPPPTQKSL